MPEGRIISGATGLAGLIGQRTLVASVVTIVDLLKRISDNNYELDRAAQEALRDLIATTGDRVGNLDKVLSDSLNSAFKEIDNRNHIALLELLGHIDSLNSVSGDQKGKAIQEAIRANLNNRTAEIEANAGIKRILAVGGATSMVVLAASLGYRYAREKTFMESILALFGRG